MMSEQIQADVAVIGGGPAGYTAAIKAAKYGKRVVLIEKDQLGGTCLNRGCIPTKALLHVAETFQELKSVKRIGIQIGESSVKFPDVKRFQERTVSTLRKGVEALLQSNQIRTLAGMARLVDAGRVEVALGDGTTATVEADKLILATGSEPKPLPIKGLDLPGVLTSTEALALDRVPDHCVIIGAGAVGIEFAYFWSSLGGKVTLVEMMPRVLPLEDHSVSEFLAQLLKRLGVEIHLHTGVSEVTPGAEGTLQVALKKQTGEIEWKTADHVLVAVGRQADLSALGTEIELDRGFIKVNARMETSIPGVYAVGDAIGGMLLAHVAMAEAEIAVADIIGEPREMDYTVIPRAIYTSPEAASVGATEEQLQEQGIDYEVGRFEFAANGKALASASREGFAKVLVDRKSHQILGVHICGPQASSLISEAVMVMRMQGTVEEVMEAVHPHPTLSENFLEAAADSLGLAVHKP